MTLWGASTSISCRTTPRSRNLLHRMLPFRRRSVNGSPPGSIGGSGQRLPDRGRRPASRSQPEWELATSGLQRCTSLRRSLERSILTNYETPPVSREGLEVKASDFNPSSDETGSRDLTTSTSCHSESDVSPVERRTPTRCCQDRGRTSLIHREHQRFHRWPYPARSVVLPTPPAPIGRRTQTPGDPNRFAVR
jgi:hypothetical protein